MVIQKGLSPEVADRVGEFVRSDRPLVQARNNPASVLSLLMANPQLAANPMAVTAFEELRLLLRYLEALGCLPRVHLDLSLARGLDYYTGVIYEVVLTETDRVCHLF